MAVSFIQALPGCLDVCGAIAQQLFIAKHNKQECQSLTTTVACIESFLTKIPCGGVSPAGNKALETLLPILFRAHALLSKVGSTGPLVSLLYASIFREEFLYINRDLTSAFQLLASGEKLLELTQARSELSQVQIGLIRNNSFFREQEQLGNRLTEIAAAAQQQHTPGQIVHKALLAQLEECDAVSGLSASELLAELQDLQLAALYGGTGTKKTFGGQTEEFLVQQLCAALAPKAAPNETVISTEARHIPDGYQCPISREIMVEPVMLVETGQSYEEANIQRWLAAHNTCPSSGKQLSSKLYTHNYNLKKSIHDWALQSGIVLPSAPPAPPAHMMMLMSHANGAGLHDSVTSQQAQQDNQQLPPAVKAATASTAARFRCTRTSWAITLMVVLVTGAVGAGVGVYLATRSASGGTTSPTIGSAIGAAIPSPTNGSITVEVAATPSPALSSTTGGVAGSLFPTNSSTASSTTGAAPPTTTGSTTSSTTGSTTGAAPPTATGSTTGTAPPTTTGSTTSSTTSTTPATTTGSTTGTTTPTTTGSTTSSTTSTTPPTTTGSTTGSTIGSTAGSTSGSTTGSTVGSTSGSTSGSTTGTTPPTNSGSTTGSTSGSTTGTTPATKTDGITGRILPKTAPPPPAPTVVSCHTELAAVIAATVQ